MTTASEAAGAPTPLGSALKAGLDELSNVQQVTFIRYVRLVLPLDGYVFWVREQMLTPSALLNRGLFNRFGPNQAPGVIPKAPPTLVVTGSVHYATDLHQDQDEYLASNRIVFTAESEVNELNAIAPGVLWIASFATSPGEPPLRFAFSSQSSRYIQADLWHYVGTAMLPDMATQVIDDLAGFNQRQIVSNSLPAWLALNAYAPAFGFALPGGLVLYPSHLTPLNERPPYGAVHIDPAGTEALASAPTIMRDSSHFQLCADTVSVTLWGMRNDEALTFIDAVYQYSANTDAIGIMNIPVVRDDKKTQAELGTIAQKKRVDFRVSYLQNRISAISRQVMKMAIVGFEIA